jgi:zinc protease
MHVLVNILNQRLAKREGAKFQALISARKLRGPFLLSASVPSKDTADAITAVIAEIKKLGNVDQSELQAAKDRIVEEYKTGFNTNTEIAARWAELENYDLGSAYIKNFITQTGRVSVEDLRRVSGQYLSPDNLTITVLGPAGQLEPDLKKLGKVEIAGAKK